MIVGSNQESGRAIRTLPICSAAEPADVRLAFGLCSGWTDGQAERERLSQARDKGSRPT